MLVDAGQVRILAERILVSHGVPQDHARIQTDLLLEAQMRGYASHGLLRLKRVIERIRNGVTRPTATGRQHWISANFLSVDGERGLGPVVAVGALAAISERARQTGIALAAIRNNNHLGMLAWYAERVAADGLILIASTVSEALVHPFGGRKAMLGTNPLAIGVPAVPEPLILDMATGLVSMGKIHDHANRDEPIPLGWALDEEGNPTTDAVAAKRGAIAPFGGAKGYALGIALEVLVTSLSAGSIGTEVKGTLDSVNVSNKGDLFIVIAPPAHDGALESLVGGYLDEIRAMAPADADTPVTVPGDRARQNRRRALTHGLQLDDGLWRDLTALDTSLVT